MVDRIDKTDRVEYWQVQASTEAQKQKHDHDGGDAYAAFQEKTDWNLLFNKGNLWRHNIKVSKEEIAQVLFRKVNLKTDPSLLRVDILLKGGEKISPAFVAISRMNAFKIKHLQSGDPLPLDPHFPGQDLTITVPTNPKLFAQEEKKPAAPAPASPSPPSGAAVDEKDETTVRSVKVLHFLLKIGVTDPVTMKTRPEMIAVYGILLLALLVVGGGLLLL